MFFDVCRRVGSSGTTSWQRPRYLRWLGRTWRAGAVFVGIGRTDACTLGRIVRSFRRGIAQAALRLGNLIEECFPLAASFAGVDLLQQCRESIRGLCDPLRIFFPEGKSEQIVVVGWGVAGRTSQPPLVRVESASHLFQLLCKRVRRMSIIT